MTLALVRSPEHDGATQYETTEVRYRVFLSVVLIEIGAPTKILGRINNLSAGGFMATHSHHTELHGPLTILIRHCDPLYGSVVWNDGKRIGISFDSVIDPYEMLAKRAHLEALPAMHSHALVTRHKIACPF